MQQILDKGNHREDRTGVGTRAIFGAQMRFDLKESFPLLTTKKLHLKSIIHELIWFLSGDTNIKYLKDNGVTIWDEWADKDGNLGPVYGQQWRHYSAEGTCATIETPFGLMDGVVVDFGDAFTNLYTSYEDQIGKVLWYLKKYPFSRRHIVCAWNPLLIDQMALPPCHCLFQFFVREENGKRYLSCQLYQRSCDFFLGVPFNIASYSLLTHIFADCSGYIPDEFVWTGGDVHLYDNHIEQAKLQLSRTPLPPSAQLHIRNHHELPWEYKFDDFEITGYESYPAIKAPIAV
jgi:thymidylate synthase